MASGFSGGGPDFYSGLAGRSMSTTMNTAANNNPAPPTYRNQLSQMLIDPSTQIVQHRMGNSSFATPGLIGKRTLAEFQAQQQQQQHQQHQHGSLNPALNGLLLRSVKPRIYQQNSPISTLSPFEFSAGASSEFPNISQHYGVPLLQQVRPQPTNLGSGLPIHSQNQTLPGISYKNAVHNQARVGGTVVMGQDSEKKMMNQLEELEKQLLDDNDEEGDAVSAITNANSEWSETIQSLISVSSPNPMAPSPSSSSSSTTSVTNPVPNCSKQTLVEAASAISEGKFDVATEILKCMAKVSNPEESSEQRLLGYMLTALKSRVNPTENPPPVTELYSKEHFGSTQLLYEVSPCFKLGLMAANFAILEASVEQPKSEDGFHVIDFDIGQGTQYMDLLYLLSERWKGKPPMTLKITALADIEEKERLKVVGDKLSQLADRLGVALRFYVVCCRLSDLSRESLGCEPDEPLAVNFAFKLYRMPDESVSIENPRDELLRRVKKLSPRVVTIVEQEMNTNTAPFTARVNETLSYYSALLESIESTLQRDSGERVKVEEGLGRRLSNSVACEGRDRLERCEVFGKWRARMGMAGFELKQMSQDVGESVKERLGCSARVNSGFNVKHVNGGVCFGWMEKTLTVASAWR